VFHFLKTFIFHLSKPSSLPYTFVVTFLSLLLTVVQFLVGCLQKYHRDLLLRLAPPVTTAQPPPPSPPPPLPMLETPPENILTPPVRKGPGRRGRDKKSGSKRHRKVVAGSTDNEAG
jgi:hypothetical protein